MSTYRVDPLNPSRLVCEVCGEAVAPVPGDLPAVSGLTKLQIIAWHDELAGPLAEHDVVCLFRRAAAEGRGPVFVHPWPRDDG